jgi:hypothetical protein
MSDRCPIKRFIGEEKRKPGRPAKYTAEQRLEARREANRRYRAKKKLQIAKALREVDELQAELELLKLFKRDDSARAEDSPTPDNSSSSSDNSACVNYDDAQRDGLLFVNEAESAGFRCQIC